MGKLKFLVVYPSPDNIDSIIEKCNSNHEKSGPFEAILSIGDTDPKTITVEPACPMYILTSSESPEDQKNIIFINPYNIKQLNGFNIAFVSQSAPIPEVIEKVKLTKIDILITYHWPLVIAEQQGLSIGESLVDEIVVTTRPRYHFAVGRFYEHSPFKWARETETTQFISLGQEGKDRWFYAFGLSDEPTSLNNTIPNPFFKKRIRPEDSDLQPKKAKILSDECYFCLTNKNLAAHMIVSIGKQSYLTVARGPLPTRGAFPFSGHLLISSIEHVPCIRKLGNDQLYPEILKFQSSLSKSFQGTEFRMIFFEVSRLNGVHYQCQGVLVPAYSLERFTNCLSKRTKNYNQRYQDSIEFESKVISSEEIDSHLGPRLNETDHFIFYVYRSDQEVEYFFSPLKENAKTDLQFPRRVLADLLKVGNRMQWTKCKQTPSEEAQECELFKSYYRNYDFTLH